MKIEEYLGSIGIGFTGGGVYGMMKGWKQANEIHSGNLQSVIGKPTTLPKEKLRMYTMWHQSLRYGLNLGLFAGVYGGLDALISMAVPSKETFSKTLAGLVTGGLFGVVTGVMRKGYSKSQLLAYGSGLGSAFGLVHGSLLGVRNIYFDVAEKEVIDKAELQNLKSMFEAKEMVTAIDKYVKDEIAVQDDLEKVLYSYNKNEKLEELEAKLRKHEKQK